MENIIKSGELERLQKELEEAKQEETEKHIIERLKISIEFLNICEKFKPIKPIIQKYINDIGYVAYDDRFHYKFDSHNDLSFLVFSFKHYTGEDYNYYDDDGYPLPQAFSFLEGYIFYDSKGNVLLEKTEKSLGHDGIKCGARIAIPKCCGIDLKYVPTFIDDEYMCIKKSYGRKDETKLYKLSNNQYELIHNFEDDFVEVNPSLWTNKLLIINRNKIYNAEENRYVLTSDGLIRFPEDKYFILPFNKDLYGSEAYNEQIDKISNYIRANNLMLITDTFEATYQEHKNLYGTICFADMKGSIVSKLYVVSYQDGKCQNYEVTNDTYSNVINKLQAAATKKLEKTVIKEEAYKKLKEEKEKNKRLLNQKEFCELMQAICNGEENSINPTLNLNPNNKN